MAKVHDSEAKSSFEIEKDVDEGCLKKSLAFRTWHVILAVTIATLVATGVGLAVYFITVGSNDSNLSTISVPPSVTEPSSTTIGITPNYTSDLVYRIPRDFLASEYTIYILPNMSATDPTKFTYHGRSTVHVTAVNPTNRIVLHANSDGGLINVNSASVRLYTASQWSSIPQDTNCEMWSITNRPPGIPLLNSVLYVPQYEYVVLVFQQTLVPGNYVLQFAWDSPITNALRGFYYSSYKDINGDTKFLALTHFSSINARRAFPCIDEPDIKAKFNMRMLTYTDATLVALSSTPSVKTATCNTDDKSYKIEYFQQTVISSTYQIAYTFSNYEFGSTHDTKGRLHRVYTRKERVPLVDYAVSTSPKILEYFEQLLMIDYDYAKLDHFSVPEFSAGAMENWGLITYRDEYLWYNASTDAISQKQRIALIMSHEIAHMWFGNLVTITWFDDLWITEGWASYGEYLGVDAVHPEWDIMQRFINDNTWNALRVDNSNTSRPLSYPVESNVQVRDMYDTITYDKGAAVMHMMSSWLGNQTFWRAVRLYLKRYSYGNTQPEYLAEVLTEAAQMEGLRVNASAVLLPWVYQGGYPVVKLSLVTEAGKTYVAMEQRRFLIDGSKDTRNTWQVPITVMLSDGSEKKFLLTKRSDRFELDSSVSWIVGNHLVGGYYRVNYDDKNWDSLSNKLLSSDYQSIDVSNRAMLVEDSFSLARTGDVAYEIVMNMTMYLSQDFEYLPWNGAISNLDYLERQSFNNDTIYKSFTTHWQKVIEPVYGNVGWTVNLTEKALRTLLRVNIISKACNLDLKDCVDNAESRFRLWFDDEVNNPLDSSLKQNILCTSIRNEPAAVWQTMYNRYYNAATDRSTYINALACSNDIDILENWLETAYKDPKITKTEFESIYSAISRNIRAKEMCRKFFYTNWQVLCTQPASTSTLRTIILNMFNTANTQKEIDEMEKFASDHKGQLSYGEVPFSTAIDNAKTNMKFVNESLDNVFGWLQRYALTKKQ